MVACICFLSGLVTLALPIGVIGANFTDLYKERVAKQRERENGGDEGSQESASGKGVAMDDGLGSGFDYGDVYEDDETKICRDMFAVVDKDEDGRISFDEFLVLARRLRKSVAMVPWDGADSATDGVQTVDLSNLRPSTQKDVGAGLDVSRSPYQAIPGFEKDPLLSRTLNTVMSLGAAVSGSAGFGDSSSAGSRNARKAKIQVLQRVLKGVWSELNEFN